MNPSTASGQLFTGIFDPMSPIFLSGNFLLGILKLMFLIGFGLYVIFAFAVLRQSVLMTRSVQTGANALLTLFSWLHLAAAVAVWLFAFFIL